MKQPLWRKVRAGVTREQGITLFQIDVRIGGQLYGSRIRVPNEEIAAFPELYNLTLDQMVVAIDDAILRDTFQRLYGRPPPD